MSVLCEFHKALEFLVSIRARETLLYLLELARSEDPQPRPPQPAGDRVFVEVSPPPRVIE